MFLQGALRSETFDAARIVALVTARHTYYLSFAGVMGGYVDRYCIQYLEGFLAACPIPAKMRTLVGSQMLGQISSLPEAPTAEITSMRSLS